MSKASIATVLSETLNAVKKSGVIPEVIDAFQNTAQLNVVYGSKKIETGKEYAVEETQQLPKVEVNGKDLKGDSSYTLLVTDPDAPRRGDPTWSEFAHYVVTDIKFDPSLSDAPQEVDFTKARELLKYMGPGPPPKTSLHRYVFLLFEGGSDKVPKDRPNWGFGKPGAGVRDWLQGQSLKPVGINFFVAQNTEQ